MPLLELEWRLEGAFTWTVTKLQVKLTWSLCLAVWLMFRPRSGNKLARFHDRRGQIERLSWGANDVYWKLSQGNEVVRTEEQKVGRSESVTSLEWLTQHNQTTHCPWRLS
ncbi:uncharacterized protein LACBIDRAFT_316689 [Laccaria bicolor S238N-H82]|uniref:Predicted protein n=1 Tax=Laccaria bicolor (strain S238N-H82 / ATCC MYA-4686) TaxID=486041 RepID=B0E1F0_LACBS|nr:uncharacterized protein LACBIDRAFT_316689 [Laccaria bicolor S238N-H82]EDQ99295.1 predicted protein [Laccaria bicolor S238N-H82]|eukprot:XP_001890015.1 predicted protein [Laccaria bicolor S238N-H82]